MKKLMCKEYWMYKLCKLTTITCIQFKDLIFRIMDCDVWDNNDNPNENGWRLSTPSFNIDTEYAVSIEYLYKNGEFDILHEESKLFTFNTINELDLKLDMLDSKIEIRNFTLCVQYGDKK